MLSQLLSLAAGPSRAPLRGPCRLAAHFHSSHPLDAVRKRTTAHRIMQGLRGRWDEDHRKLPKRQRLAADMTNRRNVHPDLLRKKPPTARQIFHQKQQQLRREQGPSSLVVGTSLLAATPPRRLSRVAYAQNRRRGAAKDEEVKKPSRKDAAFTFQAEPLSRNPRPASGFVSHPTLTSLPQHFSAPPLRDGMLSSIKTYLAHNTTFQKQSLRPSPIQRLILDHFFVKPEVSPLKARLARSASNDDDTSTSSLAAATVPKGMKPGSKTLLAAETGSGKTLAYALPIIEGLKAAEEAARAANGGVDVNAEMTAYDGGPHLRPRAVVIVPTHELARQTAAVFKSLSHEVKLRICCLSAGSGSGEDKGVHARDPKSDVVIGTIGAVRELLGMSVHREELSEARISKKESKLLEEHILKVAQEAREAHQTSWRDVFKGAAEKEPWRPDTRKTWLENLEDLEEHTEASGGSMRPEWKLPAMKSWSPREKKQHLSLEKVEWIAIDEADVVFNVDFIDHIVPVINQLFKNPTPPRMIMATATVPDSLSTFLRDQHPTTHRLITPNLHRLPATVSVDKVNWSGGNWRADVLLEIRRALIEDAREGKMDSQVIVFTNKNTKAEEFAQYLEEKDVKNVVLTSEGNRRIRGSSKPIAGFINNATDQTKAVRAHERALEEYRKDPTATPPVIYQKRPDPSAPRVLITTGLLARGIDFANTVSTAILLDEPRNALDFLHRAGRVGRAGANGKVIIFTKQKQPKIRQGGGKGRGGAIWKTVKAARARFEESNGGPQLKRKSLRRKNSKQH